MPTCRTCGDHVSAEYVRVLADRQGLVECPWCRPKSAYAYYSRRMGATYRSAPP